MIYKKEDVVEHNGFEERIREFDKKFVKIEMSMERFADSQAEIATSMKKLSDSVITLVNSQRATDESFRRVHTRIDEEVAAGKERHRDNMEKIDLKLAPIANDIEDLKKSRAWISQTIIGTIITGVIGLLMMFK